MNKEFRKKWMRFAINEAIKAFDDGETPIGAVVVSKNKIRIQCKLPNGFGSEQTGCLACNIFKKAISENVALPNIKLWSKYEVYSIIQIESLDIACFRI